MMWKEGHVTFWIVPTFRMDFSNVSQHCRRLVINERSLALPTSHLNIIAWRRTTELTKETQRKKKKKKGKKRKRKRTKRTAIDHVRSFQTVKFFANFRSPSFSSRFDETSSFLHLRLILFSSFLSFCFNFTKRASNIEVGASLVFFWRASGNMCSLSRELPLYRPMIIFLVFFSLSSSFFLFDSSW